VAFFFEVVRHWYPLLPVMVFLLWLKGYFYSGLPCFQYTDDFFLELPEPLFSGVSVELFQSVFCDETLAVNATKVWLCIVIICVGIVGVVGLVSLIIFFIIFRVGIIVNTSDVTCLPSVVCALLAGLKPNEVVCCFS